MDNFSGGVILNVPCWAICAWNLGDPQELSSLLLLWNSQAITGHRQLNSQQDYSIISRFQGPQKKPGTMATLNLSTGGWKQTDPAGC